MTDTYTPEIGHTVIVRSPDRGGFGTVRWTGTVQKWSPELGMYFVYAGQSMCGWAASHQMTPVEAPRDLATVQAELNAAAAELSAAKAKHARLLGEAATLRRAARTGRVGNRIDPASLPVCATTN